MPVLEKLYRLDPESLPFRQPVDPKQLNIPVGFGNKTITVVDSFLIMLLFMNRIISIS